MRFWVFALCVSSALSFSPYPIQIVSRPPLQPKASSVRLEGFASCPSTYSKARNAIWRAAGDECLKSSKLLATLEIEEQEPKTKTTKPRELPPTVKAAAAFALLGLAFAADAISRVGVWTVRLGRFAGRKWVETFDRDGDGQVMPHEVLRTILRERIYKQLCWLVESPWVGMFTSLLICGGALHEVFEAGAHGLKTHIGVAVIGVSHFLHYLKEFLASEHESAARSGTVNTAGEGV